MEERKKILSSLQKALNNTTIGIRNTGHSVLKSVYVTESYIKATLNGLSVQFLDLVRSLKKSLFDELS